MLASMFRLRLKPTESDSAPSLRDLLATEFPEIDLGEVTDDELATMSSEISAALMGAAFGDPRGYADLLYDIRSIVKSIKKG